MPTRADTTSCTAHVSNIRPNKDEAWAFHSFDVAFLESEASWPPLLLNYIYRWMHRHSLYNVCASKAVSISDLVDSLMLRTNLPTTELIRSKLALKCRSLIRESALKWKDGGLLVQRGSGFSKHKQLKVVWAAHENLFEQTATAILGSIPVGERDDTTVNVTADNGVTKRGANTSLARDNRKKLRTDDHCAYDSGSELSSLDCIIVDVEETGHPEPSHSECGSPRKLCLDNIPNQETHSNLMSSRSPSPSQRCGESSSVQAVHTHVSRPIHQFPLATAASTIHKAISHPNGSKDPTAVPVTPSQQLSSCENGSGVPDTAQVHTQQVEAVHQQASTILPNTTGPSDAALSESAITRNLKTKTPSTDGPISPAQAPEPVSAYMLSPPSSKPDPTPCPTPDYPVSRDLEHSQSESTTATQSTASAEVQIWEPFPSPRYTGFLSQVPKAATLEPFACGGGPRKAIVPTLQPNSPTHNSKHVLPRILNRSDTHTQAGTVDSITPSQGNPYHSVAPDLSYAYEVATLTARRGQHTAASQNFQSIGTILVPTYNQSRKEFILHVNALMSQSLTDFYAQFSELVEKGTYVSVLRFELLDLIPAPGPGQSNWSLCVSYNDQANFRALKKFVFNSFVASMSESPSLDVFRILVTAPDLLYCSSNYSVGGGRVSRTMPSHIQPQAMTQTCKGNGLNPPRTVQGLEQNVALFPQIIVYIQVDGSRRVSRPYPRAVLAPKVKNVEFFTWFAKEMGFGDPMGPRELMFSFKDAFPMPKNNLIARGNEEHFEYMKRDIKPMCEHAAVCMPSLPEFAILITVPGWATETDGGW
ncbi:hypothetical protein B0J14DRAFT_113950 [Halenospora varia]|nr:hypothetical protein B0J14DRAFT_113950 [Halenospora varia]